MASEVKTAPAAKGIPLTVNDDEPGYITRLVASADAPFPWLFLVFPQPRDECDHKVYLLLRKDLQWDEDQCTYYCDAADAPAVATAISKGDKTASLFDHGAEKTTMLTAQGDTLLFKRGTDWSSLQDASWLHGRVYARYSTSGCFNRIYPRNKAAHKPQP